MRIPTHPRWPLIMALMAVLICAVWWVVRMSSSPQESSITLEIGSALDPSSVQLESTPRDTSPTSLRKTIQASPGQAPDDELCRLLFIDREDGQPSSLDQIKIQGPEGSRWTAEEGGLRVTPGTWEFKPLDASISLSRSVVEARAFHEELVFVSKILPLHVTVLTDGGDAIADARIRWHTVSAEGSSSTDQAGRVSFPVPLRSTVQCFVSCEGFREKVFEHDFLSPSDEAVCVLTPRDASDSMFTVEVVDSSTGLPLAEAAIETSPPTERVACDGQGKALLSARILRTSSITIKAPSYAARTMTLRERAVRGGHIKIGLTPAWPLSVSCCSGEADRDLTLIAVSEVTPLWLADGRSAGQEVPRVREYHPDPGVPLVVEGFAPQATRLLLYDDRGWSDEWGPDPSVPSRGLDVQLETNQAGTLEIRALDSSVPAFSFAATAMLDIPGHEVNTRTAGFGKSARVPFPELTRRIELEGPGLSPMELGATSAFAPDALAGSEADPSGVVHVDLHPTRDVEVHVVDDAGRPVYGYVVSCQDKEATTRALSDHPELFGSWPTDNKAWLLRPTGPRQSSRGLNMSDASGRLILRDAPARNTELWVSPSTAVYPPSARTLFGFWPSELRADDPGPVTVVVESRNLCDIRVTSSTTGLPVDSFSIIGHRGERTQPVRGRDGRLVVLLLPGEQVQVSANGFVGTEFQAPTSSKGRSARVDIPLEPDQVPLVLFTGSNLSGASVEYHIIQGSDDPSAITNRGRVELLEVDGGFAPSWDLPSHGMLYLDRVIRQGEELALRPSVLDLAVVGSQPPALVEVEPSK